MEPDEALSADPVPGSASDSDRERTAEVIKAAFLAGHLDQDEYAERAGQALGSHTYSELIALTADLPAALPAVPSSAAVPVVATATPVDIPAVVLCVLSISLCVGFFKTFTPLSLLAAVIVGVIASVRAGRGPAWERITVWGVSALAGLIFVGAVIGLF